ncbi:MAG: DUF3169 family protein [Alistipes sp.]|nr:DUF3169 family protein [Alistipes sp.]
MRSHSRVWMPITIAQIPNYYGDAAATVQKFVLFAVGLILSVVVAMVASVKIVNFEKEMNPEKKGSAYDFNFQKKWLARVTQSLQIFSQCILTYSEKWAFNVISIG